MTFKNQRDMIQLRSKSKGTREDYMKTVHPGLFIASYTETDGKGFRWWLAQMHGATKKHSKTVVYNAPKGNPAWGYKKNDRVLNITWLDRSKPDQDPLVFKVAAQNENQTIPLIQILPVEVEVEQTAAGLYTISEATSELLDEWCDHVAEIA